MHRRLDRKTFVTTLGAAGLGLGLTAARGGATPARAQDQATPATAGAERGLGPLDARLQTQASFYADFTAALATQLRAPSADAVDAGVRKALMAVIDARHTSGEVTYGQAEALKTLIATTPAPLGPGPLGPALLGFHPGMAGGGMMHDQGAMNAGGMHGGMHGGNMEDGDMPGGARSDMDGMGGMQGGDMPAGQGGMAPAQEEQGGRHGRGRR